MPTPSTSTTVATPSDIPVTTASTPLPRTGVELLALLLIAVVLLALGVLLVTAGRRRRPARAGS